MELIAKTFDELSTTELYEILKSRSEVFMLGQNIICQDMDDVDYKSFHFFYIKNKRVVAYLRAFEKDGEKEKTVIGRVLVLCGERGCGIGKRLMTESMDYLAKKYGRKIFVLHSQKHASQFYEKLGFAVTSDEYLEEGVVHVTMELKNP